MNKLTISMGPMGRQVNRFMQLPTGPLAGAEAAPCRAGASGCDGVELLYPADLTEPERVGELTRELNLQIAAINFRSPRRQVDARLVDRRDQDGDIKRPWTTSSVAWTLPRPSVWTGSPIVR